MYGRFSLAFLLVFMCAGSAIADVGQRIQKLSQLVGSLDRDQRDELIREINEIIPLVKETRDIIAAIKPENPGPGWNQVYGDQCTEFCNLVGLNLGQSPEEAQCASGENVQNSALGKIDFVWGCWPNCNGVSTKATSRGRYCYKPGQKRDNDRTDVTVGCFCK